MSSDWWTDLDESILDCLRNGGPMSAADLGRRLGISAREATACVSMLATEGKVRLGLVELPDPGPRPAETRRPRREKVATVR